MGLFCTNFRFTKFMEGIFSNTILEYGNIIFQLTETFRLGKKKP